jgi:hypothetical protein
MPADRGDQVLAQLQRRRDTPVPVPVEKFDNLDPDGGRGGPLLLLAQKRHLLARRVVEPARVAPGHDQIRDLEPGVDPLGDRCGTAEVDVVGMSEHAKDTLHIRQRVSGPWKTHGHQHRADAVHCSASGIRTCYRGAGW